MTRLVKILSDEDGDIREDPVWCLEVVHDGSPRTACGGEAFGEGESACTFEVKQVQKGGITCHRCLSIIKFYKAIKL